MSSLFHPSLLSNCIGRSVDCRDASFLSLIEEKFQSDYLDSVVYPFSNFESV